MKRLGALTNFSNETQNQSMMNPTHDTPGVNVMLGGAMLSGIILVVFLLCYCCHKNSRKAEANPNSYYWRDPRLSSLEVYTVEGQNVSCYISEELPIYEIHRTPPPPSYEEVVPLKKDATPPRNNTPVQDDTGLPTYEAAMMMEVTGQGYV